MTIGTTISTGNQITFDTDGASGQGANIVPVFDGGGTQQQSFNVLANSSIYTACGADNNNYPVAATAAPGSAVVTGSNGGTYTLGVGAPTPGYNTLTYYKNYTLTMTSPPTLGRTTDTISMTYFSQSDLWGQPPSFTTTLGNTDSTLVITLSNITQPVTAPTIAAAFSPTSIAANGISTSTLTLTITNPNGATQLTGVAVAASALPANLNGSSPGTTCTSGTATYSGSGLSLSGAVLNASASCTVTLTVVTSTAGTYPYTSGAVSASGPSALLGTTATTATPLSAVGPTATQAVASKTLTQGQPSANFTPVTGSGGTAPLSYSISPTLPTGLTLNTGTGAITGVPTVTLAATTFTVTVTDANNATASNTFSLTVNSAVTATQSIANKTLTQNQPSANFTPVTGGGGTPSLTYGISSTLPSGLTFNTATGAITGSPTVTSATATYSVTATDANGASAANTFQLTVNGPVTATQAVPAVTLTQNQPSVSVTPVTGGGGTPSLTYGVSPALPAGLTLGTSSGTITGSPTVTHAASSFTVTVTDANGVSASNTFQLTINSAVTATQAVASVTSTASHAITPFTPVTGGGGTGTLSYGISPSLPTGLSLNTTNGQITGTPSGASPIATYTVTVTDTNNANASNTFSLTINGPVTATQAVPSTSLTQNRAATPFTPVTGAGGTGTLSFGISPGLPAGLSFNTTNGQITGTATVTSGAATYTVTVTDANSATASNTFSLTVNSAVTATQAVPSTTLTANHAAPPFTPVTAAGGTGTLSYGVSPALPAGLTLSTSTGQVTGTPTTAAINTTYTVTATDVNGAAASNTFLLLVNGAVTATQAVPSTTLTANHAATPFTPVTGGGGTGTLAYSVSPTLPAGLSFNTANGQITGTPTTSIAATTFTVTVTDSNSATASNTFSLTVNGAVTATQAIATKVLTQNQPSVSFTPVTGSGGTTPLTYSIAPALPAGLTLATGTGAISGVPTGTLAATTFTVTVTDANSATATATFSLTINGGVTATQAVPSTILTAKHAAPAFTPVTGGGGTAPISYSVSPTLPAGLTLNASNGNVSGTPTATIGATAFTVTVTDANGATATNTFSLTVNGAVTATTAIASKMLTLNQAATPFTPVTGSGGTGALTYALSPALSAGLSFNTATGAISGTPTAPQPSTVYTVTITDTNNASANATFTLLVGQAPTTVTLTSSLNPSQFNQAVTFTATVKSTSGSPTGTVTFNDNGTPIGTATLSAGVAAFITSTLTVGSHTIIASYGGTAIFQASISTALAQTVNVPTDSVRLRALQINVTKMVAQASGQAISGAISDAITDGFSEDGGAFLLPGPGRMRFNFTADARDADDAPAAGSPGSNAFGDPTRPVDSGRRGRGRVNNAFAAIDQQAPKKALPKWHEEKQWLLWADVRGSGVDRWSTTTVGGAPQANQASLYGQQLNALIGVTYKATPNFLVGFVGGWETFSYTQQDINGKLKGDGWTTGGYLGWKIAPTLRFDAAVTYSGIGYNGTAGTAQGNFDGQRWMVSTGLTGMYKAYGFLIEPSARVYALWEHENAYVDTLGTQQGVHDFASGRASGGVKVAYPVAWLDSGLVLTPFFGVYGDYYFNREDAAAILAAGAVPLASTPLLEGWSARLTGGLGAKLPSGGAVGVGAEYGGLGGNTRIWTFSAKAQVPFGAR